MLSSFLKKVGAAASAAVAATGLPSSSVGLGAPIVIGNRTVRIRDQLGEGGYAFVYSVEDVNSGEILALKRMIAGDREQKDIAEKEIAIMKQLRGHAHIIQFLGACTKESQNGSRATEYYLLMEMGDGGSLIKEIQHKQSMGEHYSEREICQIFHQICLGLDCLHSQNPPICHRDLKIENVLIKSSANGRKQIYKLCDFGSCTTRAQAYNTKDEILSEEERIQKFSTSMYRAPEMIDLYKREVVNEKVDIWAAGCILFTLAYFTQPFQEGGTLQILSGNYEIPENNTYSKYLTSLIKRLLTVQPAKRPDIKFVLKMVEHWEHWLKSGGKENVPNVMSAALSSASSAATDSVAPRKKSLNRESSAPDNSEKRSKEKSEEKEVKKKKKTKSKDLAALQKGRMLHANIAGKEDFAADWNPFAADAQQQNTHANQQLTVQTASSTPMSAPSAAAHSAANAVPYTQVHAPTGPDSLQTTKVAMLFDLTHMQNPLPPPPHLQTVSASTPTAQTSGVHPSHMSTPPPPSRHSVDASAAFKSDEWAKFSPPPQRVVAQADVEPGEDDWAAFESASFDAVKAPTPQPIAMAYSASSSFSSASAERGGERTPNPYDDALAAAPGIFFAQTPSSHLSGTASSIISPASKKKLKKVSNGGDRQLAE